MKVNNLENNVKTLEINGNHFKQFGRRNNLEIRGIADGVNDEYLEEKVIRFLRDIQFNISSSDIEACHRISNRRNLSKEKNKSPIY